MGAVALDGMRAQLAAPELIKACNRERQPPAASRLSPSAIAVGERHV